MQIMSVLENIIDFAYMHYYVDFNSMTTAYMHYYVDVNSMTTAYMHYYVDFNSMTCTASGRLYKIQGQTHQFHIHLRQYRTRVQYRIGLKEPKKHALNIDKTLNISITLQ